MPGQAPTPRHRQAPQVGDQRRPRGPPHHPHRFAHLCASLIGTPHAQHTNGASILTPEEVSTLLVLPAMGASIAAQVSTVVHTGSKDFRLPIVQQDPTAAWVAEGQEISPSDATLAELTVTPSKVAGLSIITNELANDSTPEAAAVVGDGLARDIARKVDAAYFGTTAPNAPAGLGSLTAVSVVDTGTAIANTDVYAEALSKAEQVGATITSFVANPADALALAKVKKATGSNEPLLGNDPTSPTSRTILGVPLYVSPAVAAGTIWGIDKARSYVIVREDASVEADASPYFTSDRTAIRATMRVGFGFPHPAALVRL